MYLIANTPVGIEKKWPEIKAPLSRLQSNSKAWTAAMNVLTAELHNSRSSVLTVIHVNERDRNISAAAGIPSTVLFFGATLCSQGSFSSLQYLS